MRKQCSPHREETLQPHFRDNGRLGDNKRPYTLPHLMPGSPAALPIPLADPRRTATASMTPSGHENGERDRWTAIGHSDPLESKLKWLP